MIPLIVAVDPFINETSCFIELHRARRHHVQLGHGRALGRRVPSKSMVNSVPGGRAEDSEAAEGHTISVETFLIALAKALGGFGEGAIKGVDGKVHPLDRAEDWYYRAANVAFTGKAPVGGHGDDDVALAGVTRIMPSLKAMLRRTGEGSPSSSRAAAAISRRRRPGTPRKGRLALRKAALRRCGTGSRHLA